MSRHEVTIRMAVDFYSDARLFNADDVRALAAEGVDSHYDVIEVVVIKEQEVPDESS